MGLRANAKPLWVMGDIVTSIRYDELMEQTGDRISRKKAARAAWLRDLRRLWLLVPGVVAFVLTMLARANPDACEELFSRGAYPWISSVWGYLPSLVGFSMAQWVVIVAVILVICMIVHYIMRIITRRGGRLRYLYRLITSALGIISIAFFLYAMLCGLNYYRHTFAQNEGFEVRESTAQELTDLCNDLVTELNTTRAELGDDMQAHIDERGGFAGYAVRSVDEMKTIAEQYPTLERPVYSQPKPVTLFSQLMSCGDITGMYFAFTVESNINTLPPFYTIPATMGHELAHQCGYMREDEANFIAYLACKQSGDALIRYSGYSLAYSYALSALAQTDEDAARAVSAQLSEEVRADRMESMEFWAEYEGPFRTFAQQANDAYLKANDQLDGTQSYGRMVDLLLAERRES